MEDDEKEALSRFPLKLIETSGRDALARWETLISARRGAPVVLAGDDGAGLDDLLVPFYEDDPDMPPAPAEEILAAAAGIRFPEDLVAYRRREAEESIKELAETLADNPDRDEILSDMSAEPGEAMLGEWPDEPEASPGLTVAHDARTGQPLKTVYVGVAPTDDGTAIPAYLRWGGWNECPPAAYHVAALRSWRDRYGAELVGMSHNVINIRVKTRPRTREEALALAREQYLYCADIVDQGLVTLSALAAALMASDWWYFWWD